MEYEKRFTELERKHRQLQVVGLALIMVAFAPFLIAAQADVDTLVSAKGFDLVDRNGKVRASLRMEAATGGDEESAYLTFYHSNGTATARYDQMGLKYFDMDSAKETVSLRNFLGLKMSDSKGDSKVLLWVNYDGKGVFDLNK